MSEFNLQKRLSSALHRDINFNHEKVMDVLHELLTIVEQYQDEYQDTVKAIRKHYAEGKK
jgi:hypothetical protein